MELPQGCFSAEPASPNTTSSPTSIRIYATSTAHRLLRTLPAASLETSGIMRLLQLDGNGNLSLTEFLEDNIPVYAILSHRWGAEEVTFKDMTDGTYRVKAGYGKIQFCGEQARHDALEYFWVDTCCIDKSSSAELSKAINSMFRWYRDANKCYVYLSDVSTPRKDSVDGSNKDWELEFRKSEWFRRGWTLQELIAPAAVDFFSREGELLGNKASLEQDVCEITGIPATALRGRLLSGFSVAERMSWAERRETTYKEDKAYSLLGIFDVYMPLIYGEGRDRAMQRLREEIEKASKSHKHEDFSVTLSLSDISDVAHFVAREDELSKIHKTLNGNGSRRTIVLHGLGGIGKTQLSIAYAKRHKDNYSAIFWLNLQDEDSLKQSFIKIAKQISREHPSAIAVSILETDQDLDEVVNAVKSWLSLPNNSRWLMIYDNYDNPKVSSGTDPTAMDIGRFLPESYQGSIIITTRSSEVGIGHQIQIRKLGEVRDCLEILSTTSRRKGLVIDPDAIKLVKELDGLPLALATAGAYLKQASISVSNYYRLYKESWAKLQKGSPRLVSYEYRSLSSTWEISFDYIKQRNPLSANLLRLWAYFDNQDLWFELLRHSDFEDPDWIQELTQDEVTFHNAMQVLSNHGLVEIATSSQEWRESKGYSIHRCVHSWTIHALNQEWDYDLARLAVKYVGAHVPRKKDIQPWLTQRRLLQHAARCSYMIANSLVADEKLLDECHNLGNLYFDQGKFYLAEQMYQRALQGYEKALGLDHISALDTVNNIGKLFRKQGKLDLAEQMYQRALQGYEKALGPEHISALDTVNNIGKLFRKQGKLDLAEQMYQRALQGYEKALGPEHTSTLNTINNLGLLYLSQGKLSKFEKMYRRALQGYEMYSTLDRVTLTGMAKVASEYRHLGRWAVAERLDVIVLAMRMKVLGQEHPDTLTSMKSLATTYRNLGRETEANELEAKSDSIKADILSKTQDLDQRRKEESLDILEPDTGDDLEDESDISDVPSVFSTDSLTLSDSTVGDLQTFRSNTSEQLVAELLKDYEMKSLYETALKRLGKARFARAHDILIKEFLMALRLGATGHQLQVVRILRSKQSRISITTQITGLLAPTDLPREQAMRDFQKLEADRLYSLSQFLKPPIQQPILAGSAGDTKGSVNSPDERSEDLDVSEVEGTGEESGEESDEESEGSYDSENLEDSEAMVAAVMAFLIKGMPFSKFKTRLRNIVHPPTTLQEALNSRHLRTVRRLLKTRFHFVSKDDYSWLHDLREAGYSCLEMAELLLEEADYAPWIPFDPNQLARAHLQQQTHLPRCVHQANIKNSNISPSNLDMSTEDLLRKNEEVKRAVQELCGLAGISPTSRDPKNWNGNVEFGQENTHANVCYTCHVDEESKFQIVVSRITRAIEGFYDAFSHIQQAGLSCNSFTVLVNLTTLSPTLAIDPITELPTLGQVELCRMELTHPLQLRKELNSLSILKKITQVEIANCRKIAQTILAPLFLNTGQLSMDSDGTVNNTLHLCAVAVQFLCLGLLSYTQAHVGAIHPFYLDTPQGSVLLKGTTRNDIEIIASLKYLSCFGDMLQRRPVWTFNQISQPTPSSLLYRDNSRYDLLASPEDLLDTWGPGQFVYRKDNQENPCAIIIGGGIIFAADDADTFHWSLRDPINNLNQQMDLHHKENARTDFGTDSFTVLFKPYLKIAIGTLVTVNETCSLDEERCWNNCYHTMQPLGTSGPYWRSVERQTGVQAGQYVLAQLNQTWAKDDGKTLKQMVLDYDDTYLISFLECRWGVQVSFCTGVAKRVLLRQLVADLIPLFAKRAISIALVNQDVWEDLVATEILEKFQNQKFADWYPSLRAEHRKVISDLTCCIIRTLKETGLDRDGNLVIAWPREHDVYQCFKIPCRNQSYWAQILADSKDSATFAYVSIKCLVSSQVHCSGPTSIWRNVSTMLGTAVLPPMSVLNPNEWVLQHGGRYFIRTRDSLVHLSVHVSPGEGGTSTYACLITKPINVPEQIKNRLLNRKWQKEEGRLRERRDDIQHSVDVLVLNRERTSVAVQQLTHSQ